MCWPLGENSTQGLLIFLFRDSIPFVFLQGLLKPLKRKKWNSVFLNYLCQFLYGLCFLSLWLYPVSWTHRSNPASKSPHYVCPMWSLYTGYVVSYWIANKCFNPSVWDRSALVQILKHGAWDLHFTRRWKSQPLRLDYPAQCHKQPDTNYNVGERVPRVRTTIFI